MMLSDKLERSKTFLKPWNNEILLITSRIFFEQEYR